VSSWVGVGVLGVGVRVDVCDSVCVRARGWVCVRACVWVRGCG
jgi:hypothetical protein